jgi:hypothetical protein
MRQVSRSWVTIACNLHTRGERAQKLRRPLVDRAAGVLPTGAHDLNCEGEDLTEAHRRVQPSHPRKLGTPKAVKLLCWRRFRPARAYWCVRGGSELPRGDVASADLA